jgi:multidrug efflux pump subunit AcrA (membrane-fusion protein)
VKRTTWVLTGTVALGVVAVLGAVIALSGADSTPGDAQAAPVSTATVQKGELSTTVSQSGTLTYRAQPDGSPYAVINQATGTYTQLPEAGDKVGCGGVLYRVDDRPVLMLCGTVPVYRALHTGDAGPDIRQLNRNLHQLGYDAGAGIDPDDDHFTAQTQKALGKLQHDKGLSGSGSLATGDAVFLPDPVRIAEVAGKLAGSAQPGTQVLDATSDTLQVNVALDASQQGAVHPGDRAEITLPSNQSATGKVDRLGTVAQAPAGQGSNAGQRGAGGATIPAYISLDEPGAARGFDEAPVQVDITSKGVENALSVPVTALVGKSGGGFAVEVVRDGGRRDLVAVDLGLFDSSGGRVAVQGDLREGDLVVVPSS